MSANGMVQPCSCAASDRSWQGHQRQGARFINHQTTPYVRPTLSAGSQIWPKHPAAVPERGPVRRAGKQL